ncbi:MAG: tetratricopeptide repeat protein [Gemmatimonadetes bacterium]|nr:tetratricopeptide repeat protein [Gemmatimonadota bacterium]MYE92522.1 tetratricopeptide repeat protein [Gemmatimonadota bacterium]MYJ09629.1 tetratricopeptide repeat protein [Gemmatimonadota bacterium]
MAIATTSYNPGFLTADELRTMFCVRVGEFESLLETLRENSGQSNQHVVVVGPRGSGKTTLLLRVALEVGSDPELSSRLYPIVFAEESYSVSTCGEFWLECLSRLAQQVPHRPGEPDLQRTVEDVRKERDDRALRERCLGALLDFAEREKKRLVLHVENLNMLFSDMMDPDAEWCLRKTLQTEPRVMIVGSATSRFEEIDRPDRPLYDLFRVLTLRPLGRQESAVLCERESGRALDNGVVRRLQILTGGSPRLLAIVARFAAARSLRTLMSDLLDLVDEHTAYFKSHLESLPAQERRVYLALAELWKPATAREVGNQARMETSACSAQLRRLMGRGVVADGGGTNRRKQYYVSERLYNIYYLLRRSRGTDSLVGALVKFMDAYYSRTELQEFADSMVAELDAVDPHMRPIYLMALQQFSSLPELAWHFYQEYPDHVPDAVRTVTEEASALLVLGGNKLGDGDVRGALRVLRELVQRYRGHRAPTVRDLVVMALVNRGNILAHEGRDEEALPALEEAVEVSEAADSPELRPNAATALLNQSILLTRLGRTQDAMDACDRLIDGFPGDRSDPVARQVAMALLNRGVLLGRLDRTEEALVAYDELQNRFGASESVGVLAAVATGQVNKAATLFELQRPDETLKVCEDTWGQFKGHESSLVLLAAGSALTIKSAVLSVQGRTSEHLVACDELLNRLDQHERNALTATVADYDAEAVHTLRLTTRGIRVLTYIKQGNMPAVADDTREILRTLPQLATIPSRSIQSLMVASCALGFDRMAALIRESPSTDHLLPLTTALEWEMGKEPRVAIEIRKVAEDMRRELAQVREHLSSEEADES